MIRIPAREWEALAALVANGVRFVLVGGHAVVWHGGLRETADVDLLVDTAEPNPGRLYNAVIEIVGRTPAFEEADLRLPGKHIRFAPSGLAIDALTSGPGIGFEQAWQGSIVVTVDELSFRVIGRSDLIDWLAKVAERFPNRRADALRDLALLKTQAAG